MDSHTALHLLLYVLMVTTCQVHETSRACSYSPQGLCGPQPILT